MDDRTTTVAQLRQMLEGFVAEREWHVFHDPKNLSASIAIEAAELMEHFQWVRSEEVDDVTGDEKRMAAIREEAADVFAYLLAFANRMKIDLSSALEHKMKKNAAKYPVSEFRGRFQ